MKKLKTITVREHNKLIRRAFGDWLDASSKAERMLERYWYLRVLEARRNTASAILREWVEVRRPENYLTSIQTVVSEIKRRNKAPHWSQQSVEWKAVLRARPLTPSRFRVLSTMLRFYGRQSPKSGARRRKRA